MKILILEDDPERMVHFNKALRNHDVVHVEESKMAIEHLKLTKFDVLFLDHDLGGKVFVKSGEGTGYEVAKFLEENPEYMPNQIFLHSFNQVGRKNMQKALPEAIDAPGVWLGIEGPEDNE